MKVLTGREKIQQFAETGDVAEQIRLRRKQQLLAAYCSSIFICSEHITKLRK
jgi:hypothetical protein